MHYVVEEWFIQSCQWHDKTWHTEQDFQDLEKHTAVDLHSAQALRSEVVFVIYVYEKQQRAKLYIQLCNEEEHNGRDVSDYDQAAHSWRDAGLAKFAEAVDYRSNGHDPAKEHYKQSIILREVKQGHISESLRHESAL